MMSMPHVVQGVACAAVLFCLTGCAAFRQALSDLNGPPAVQAPRDDGAQYFVPLARRMGLEPAEGRRACDLATDVEIALGRAEVRVPQAMSEESATRMRKMLTREEQRQLDEARAFIKSLEGTRVYAFPASR